MKSKRAFQFRHLLGNPPPEEILTGGTSNAPHRTSNAEPARSFRDERLVRCSAFDGLSASRRLFYAFSLFACLGGGFEFCLRATEPSIPSDTTTATAAPAQRALDEAGVLQLLTRALQDGNVKDRGELELRVAAAKSWTTRNVPDEPITVKILELPNSGVSASFIVRFELRSATGAIGTFQLPLQARIWRDIWIARSAVKRGDLISDADLSRERRDLLALREAAADFPPGDTTLEMAEPLQPGSALLARSVKARPVMHRGQMADALVQDGVLSINLKVEVLEDGAPGQIIRARNAQSRRDIRGKVLNEQTILVLL